MAETFPLRGRPAGEGLAAGTAQRNVLPVESFSPTRGLTIDRTEKSASITGAMELSGAEANVALIQSSINTTWTQTFPDGYSVSCNIAVTYRPPGSEAGNATQIMAEKITRPSYVLTGLRGRSMNLNTKESDTVTIKIFAPTEHHPDLPNVQTPPSGNRTMRPPELPGAIFLGRATPDRAGARPYRVSFNSTGSKRKL